MRGLFVTGTGTGVGKTIVSACLLAAMRAAGEPVRAYKPVLTGLDEPPGEWPPDHELLGLAAGMDPEQVAPLRYGPAVSPHLAAQLAGESIDPAVLVARARDHADRTLVVEGVGGLLVPLAGRYTVRDLAAELGLPLVIAASTDLGTINHTLLTIESARAGGLDVRAVVLTPWPDRPDAMQLSNRMAIARLGGVDVVALPPLRGPQCNELIRGAERLAWREWLVPEFHPKRSLRSDDG